MGPGDELPVSLGFIILKARAAGLEKEAWNMGRRGWRMSGGGGGRGCSGEIQYYKGGGSHTLGDLIDNYIILLVALGVMETYPTTALEAFDLSVPQPALLSLLAGRPRESNSNFSFSCTASYVKTYT